MHVLAPRIGLSDGFVTFIIFIAALAFPLVLAVAWLFERTPEGLRRTASSTLVSARSRAVALTGVGVISVLVAFGAYRRLGSSEETGAA